MKRIFLLLFVTGYYLSFAQTVTDTSQVNQRYFEDQFYAGITYNFILDLPDQASQRNISYGLQAGFIKDIPLNEDRTFGFGLGMGLALYTYYTNIRSEENGDDFTYKIVTDEDEPDFKRSKLETHLLEVPMEFRWRNSDTSTYSFWRIYAGVKFGYAFNARSKFVLTNTKESFRNTDVRSLQYGLTLNFGYHNFNIHAYYSLANIFNDDVFLSDNVIEFTPLRVGLIFYIL